MAKLNAILTAEEVRLACASLRIHETPTHIVNFDGNPAAFRPGTPYRRPRWTLADMGISDFGPAPPASEYRLGAVL
jgi:hypothetical protein